MDELMQMNSVQMQPVAASAATAMSTTREAQEVQAAVFMAKRFPRDENMALARISKSCQRRGLAEKAIYSYPKGGQNVTGPSIRLAEAISQAWGNIQSGVVELEQRPGESVCMSYCWDLETNTRDTKIFTVSHSIQTKKGSKMLTDPREIYEHVANQGARRKRACILAVIPKDVVDSAVEACQKTLSSGQKEPLIDRLRKMVNVFQTELSVPLECIEKYMGYKKLWKLLIDKDMKKKDLCAKAGISPASVTKMGRNGFVTTEVLEKICVALDCQIGDVMEIIPEEKSDGRA